jgi:hypothetical protein
MTLDKLRLEIDLCLDKRECDALTPVIDRFAEHASDSDYTEITQYLSARRAEAVEQHVFAAPRAIAPIQAAAEMSKAQAKAFLDIVDAEIELLNLNSLEDVYKDKRTEEEQYTLLELDIACCTTSKECMSYISEVNAIQDPASREQHARFLQYVRANITAKGE